MAKETIVLEAEIKSNIGEVSKETKELTNDFGAFGITIGGIKDKFKDVAKIMTNGLKQIKFQAQLAAVGFKQMFSGDVRKGAKTLFTVIKTGIAATGIGLLLVAFTSLALFFTKTKKGAELLEVAFTGIGAAVSVIVDRVAKFGGAIVKLFKGDVKGALTDVKGAFNNIGAEIAADTKAAIALKRALQTLTDEQRKLNVEVAQNMAYIEQQKLIAEDITKSYAERESAATKAFNKENELEAKRLELAEEAVRVETERHNLLGADGVMAEDLDALADMEITLADVRAESAGRQLSLLTFLNSLRAEELAKLEEIKAAEAERFEGIEKLVTETIEANQELILADNSVLDNYLANNEKKKQSDKAVKDGKVAMAQQGLALVSAIAGEGTALAKTAAIAQTTISGIQSVQEAFKSGSANIPMMAATGGSYGFIQAGLAGAFSAVQLAKILSVNPSGGGGGGSGAGSGAVPSTPAPQMMSGAFDISGGVAPEATKAYVVTDEMSNSQNQLANIRRRATI